MFQVTVDRTDDCVARSWLRHFETLGRPAGLVDYYGWLSVWRDGMGVRGMKGNHIEFADKPRGVLIQAVNGFQEQWSGKCRMR